MTISKENNYNYEMANPPITAIKTDTSYNNPGMPKPPAGWDKKLSIGPMPGGSC